jgi:hypothetical protein
LENELPFPVYRVTAGNLKEDLLSGERVATAPFYTGDSGILWRQCTTDYKIQPIRKKLKELAKPKRGEKELLVEQWMGISWDEMVRMKDSKDKWIKNRWPLIEKQMTRLHCLEWMEAHNYPKPARSACTFCPYHDNKTWRDMKENDKESWDDAVEFDKKIRNALPKVREEVFIHKDRVPLVDADLTNPYENQLSLLDECDGMCGV